MITAAARNIEPLVASRGQTPSGIRAIGGFAADCLAMELETWPKPGLVSHVDNGSHVDMDAGTFRRSAAAIRPYLQSLAEAGALGCGMGVLRVIGLEAERAMLEATAGVNTHRGAIFGLGLLCAAAGARAGGLVDPALPLGDVVARLWGASILDGPVLLHSHGSAARRRFRAGGARIEAASGFPSVYRIGLPALASSNFLATRLIIAPLWYSLGPNTLKNLHPAHCGGILSLRATRSASARSNRCLLQP